VFAVAWFRVTPYATWSDLNIQVTNSTGQKIASGATPNPYEFTRFDVTTAGTYYLVVHGKTLESDPFEFGWALSHAASGQGVIGMTQAFGQGCSGSNGVPTLGFDTIPVIGGWTGVTLTGAPANTLATLVWGTSDRWWLGVPLPIDLTPSGAPGCSLYVSQDLLTNHSTGSGSISVRIDVPRDGALIGVPGFYQWLVADPGVNQLNLTTSNGGKAITGQQ
jgi:hypothetical protein